MGPQFSSFSLDFPPGNWGEQSALSHALNDTLSQYGGPQLELNFIMYKSLQNWHKNKPLKSNPHKHSVTVTGSYPIQGLLFKAKCCTHVMASLRKIRGVKNVRQMWAMQCDHKMPFPLNRSCTEMTCQFGGSPPLTAPSFLACSWLRTLKHIYSSVFFLSHYK